LSVQDSQPKVAHNLWHDRADLYAIVPQVGGDVHYASPTH